MEAVKQLHEKGITLVDEVSGQFLMSKRCSMRQTNTRVSLDPNKLDGGKNLTRAYKLLKRNQQLQDDPLIDRAIIEVE